MRQWGDRRLTQLEQYLSNYLIIPVDQSLCQEWAQVRANRQSARRPISPQDAWIAATALRYDLPLVKMKSIALRERSLSYCREASLF
ncbi:PIN domain-containing protein [Nostoc sp. CHAB 5784]|uniref:PIN domain-containing protein n=1 Tax=Nostoc mirabile TaxID=2907820 RepID=UPI001E5CB995|nr:PIN domain-containing protein [Nostoc mirabile]MCC5662769.1 PIN domain-containing protein [Nostoc mirabile CHAB5784]